MGDDYFRWEMSSIEIYPCFIDSYDVVTTLTQWLEVPTFLVGGFVRCQPVSSVVLVNNRAVIMRFYSGYSNGRVQAADSFVASQVFLAEPEISAAKWYTYYFGVNELNKSTNKKLRNSTGTPRTTHEKTKIKKKPHVFLIGDSIVQGQKTEFKQGIEERKILCRPKIRVPEAVHLLKALQCTEEDVVIQGVSKNVLKGVVYLDLRAHYTSEHDLFEKDVIHLNKVGQVRLGNLLTIATLGQTAALEEDKIFSVQNSASILKVHSEHQQG
ncbi:hypothetical protein FHG87_014546 [Trinorchestia longiramus]|nr:hypothetical protein FHG87_014546 [Trinorchestia longiramus]